MKTMSFIKYYRQVSKDPNLITRIIGESQEPIKMVTPFLKPIYYITDPIDIQYVLSSRDYVRDPMALRSVRDIMEGGIDVPVDNLPQDAKVLMQMFTEEREKQLISDGTTTFNQEFAVWDTCAKEEKPFNLELELTCLLIKVYLNAFLSGISIKSVPDAADLINHIFYSFSPLNYPLRSLGKIPGPFTRELRLYNERKKKTTALGFELMEQSMSQNSTNFNFVRYLADSYQYPKDLKDLDINMKRHLAGRAFATMVSATHNLAGELIHTLVQLSKNPTIRNKIAEEVANTIGNNTPTYEDLNKLVYTKGVLLETMRLYPTVLNIFRISNIDDKLSTIKINKGDIIMMPALVTHKLTKYWENPEGFEPERFMKPLTPQQQTLFISFAHGPQGCVARRFALLEGTLFLAMLAQRFHLDLIPGTPLHFDKNILFFAGRLNPEIRMRITKSDFRIDRNPG